MRPTVATSDATAVGATREPSDDPRTRDLTLTVAMLTFRRVDQLRGNLPVVLEQVTAYGRNHPQHSLSVLVIDNDPDRSAESLITRSFPEVRYVAEPTPGIAAARNRAVHESDSSDLLVFIDDDERPRPGWLPPLIDTWRSTGATAVPGRVVSRYETEPDPWIVSGGFFDRPRRIAGTRMQSFAAGNVLLDLQKLRDAGLSFEEPFGSTGGEDSLLGQRLTQSGHHIIWCADSVVEDLVPADRLTRRWVLQRAYSQGNLQALIDRHMADGALASIKASARRAAAGAVYLTQGTARAARGYLTTDQARQADGLRRLCRGAGMFAGLAGHAYAQYARTTTADEEI